MSFDFSIVGVEQIKMFATKQIPREKLIALEDIESSC